MTDPHQTNEERSQNSAERLVARVSGAVERAGDVGHAIVEGVQERVEQLESRFHREEPAHVGETIPFDIRPVRPQNGSSTGLAWRVATGRQYIGSRASAGFGASRVS